MRAKVLSASVQGASHKRVNKECQDSVKEIILENAIILSVADGHGSNSCPYSKTGSASAVNVFCSFMEEYCKKYADDMEQLSTFFSRSGDNVAREIDKEWKRRTEENHRKNKRETTQNNYGERDKVSIWRQYGTTLLGLVITPFFYFAFQLGDGDILYLSETGVEHIIQSDKILGTETHSLSRPQAWKKAVTSVGRLHGNPSSAFMLTTDGFSNSYPNESAFLQACSEYYAAIREHGVYTVSDNLKNWLDETSENGSGDDITVLIAVTD